MPLESRFLFFICLGSSFVAQGTIVVMPNEFDLSTTADRQVIVILHADCQISQEAILSLLHEAGIDIEAVIFLGPDEASSCADLDDTPVVIPLDAAVCDQPDLEVAARYCSNAGGRVITIFGPEFSYDSLHPIAEKYGTQCDWSPGHLASHISESEADTPIDAKGSEVRRLLPNQVKCN